VALASLSCASINFNDVRVDRPPREGAAELAIPGQVGLHDCLALLGAPTRVERAEGNERYVLTWEWLQRDDWSFSLSVPFGDQSASFSWRDQDFQPQFVRLFFDRDWRLVDKAEG
jgi:hypothetical protein